MTDEQRANCKAKFIESVDRQAVYALASRYNYGLPCRFEESALTANGSFINVCFFVEFHTGAERTQWVIRVPIKPVIGSAGKVHFLIFSVLGRGLPDFRIW